jgi:hypothetical protein
LAPSAEVAGNEALSAGWLNGVSNRLLYDGDFHETPSFCAERAVALGRKIKNPGRSWKIDLIERPHSDWIALAAAWAPG